LNPSVGFSVVYDTFQTTTGAQSTMPKSVFLGYLPEKTTPNSSLQKILCQAPPVD